MDKPVIAIIDDDPNLRKTLSDILRAKGYEALSAGDGQQGLDLMQHNRVDLALVDLKLPDISGLEVLERIRADHPHTEVIILTGNASLDSAIEATNKGAFSYLQKPYDIDQLLVHIRRAIEKRQAEDALKQSEERFKAIMNTANDAIICIKPDDVVYLWNKKAEDMFGYSASEAAGRDVHLLLVPEKYRESMVQGLKTFLQTGEGPVIGKSVEITALNKAGAEFPVELSLSGMKIGEQWHATAIIRDITGRKQAEMEIQHNNDIQRATSSLLSLSLEDVSLETMLDRSLDEILSISWLVSQRRGSIFLVDDDSGELVMKASNGLDERIQEKCSRVPLGRCLCGLAAATSHLQFAACVDERHVNSYEGILPHGHYCIPVLFAGKTLGVLNLYLQEGHPHIQKEEEFLTTIAKTLAGIIVRKHGEETIRQYQDHLEELVRERTANLEAEIAERKQAEATLRISEEKLLIKDQINTVFLTYPDEEMYGKVLQLVLRAMNSVYGTFGYFSEDGNFVAPAVSREIYWEKCNVPDRDIVFHKGTFGGIWGKAIKERKTQVSNEGPFNVPTGHITIENTMVTPVIFQDNVISALHVANKTNGYDKEDRKMLEMIADQISPVLYSRLQRDKKEQERKLAEVEIGKLNEDLKRHIAELEEARILADAGIRARGAFLANISHELITPLNSIIGFSQVLLDGLGGPMNGQQKEYAASILQGGDRLHETLKEIVQFAGLESGEMRVHTDRFLLKDLLKSSLLALNEKAAAQGVALSLELGLPPETELEADRGKLQQAVFNLIDNAVKFTPKGGSVRVSAQGTRDEERGTIEAGEGEASVVPASEASGRPSSIVISVADTGIGIKPEDMPRLFKPFLQLESPYTKQYKGTGLGLMLAKKIIELHGGRIWVESEIGKGSTFTFVIPVKHEGRGTMDEG